MELTSISFSNFIVWVQSHFLFLIIAAYLLIVLIRPSTRKIIFQLFEKKIYHSWPPHVQTPLSLDLRSMTITFLKTGTANAIPWNSSVSVLEKLGKPSNLKAAARGIYQYFPSGLTVSNDQQQIDHWEFSFQPDQNFSACVLEIILPSSERYKFSNQITPTQVVKYLGNPVKGGSKEGWLSYQFGPAELYFEFDDESHLEDAYLTKPIES